MADVNTIILLPDSPEEIGVLLPPPTLRRIDFSALDFESMRRMAVEYIKTYYPNDFNDFILSNGMIMMVELTSAIGNSLSERSDILVDESFLPTAQSRTAVENHLELIGQTLGRATPSVVDIECSLPGSLGYDVTIPPGQTFSLTGPDGNVLTYELFKSPGDYVSSLFIPRAKRAVIGYAVEGRFGSDIIVTANGEPNQFIDITTPDVLDDPIMVLVKTGSIEKEWTRIDFLQRADAEQESYQVQHFDDRTRVLFGDNANGKIPLDGQVIRVRYRQGGGIRGRIGRNAINETRPVSQARFATANVIFRNSSPSRGGHDNESLDEAKRRAPRDFATHNNAATADDYSQIASQFRHPVYGSVSKSIAVIRSGIDADIDAVVSAVRSAPSDAEAKKYLLANYVNRNIVEFYILQEGEDLPIAPNAGLKASLRTSLSQINVFTDELRIEDGKLKPIDIDATVVMSRNANPGVVKEQVLYQIKQLFNIANRNMGEGFDRSSLITSISNVDGVKSVDLFGPADDFPALRALSDGSHSVGLDELVVLGKQNIKFYFEQGNVNI